MSDDIQDSELIYELEADPPPAEKFCSLTTCTG